MLIKLILLITSLLYNIKLIQTQILVNELDHIKFSNSIGLLISNKYDFYDYTAYGNELHQANEYFSIIDNNITYKNKELDSYKYYYACFTKTLSTATTCTMRYNSNNENITPFYEKYIREYTINALTRSLDCDYDVKLNQIVHKHDKYYVKFNINEHHCKSNLSLSSGSSFDSYALTEKSLVACKQYSYSNSSLYDIVCVFPHQQINDLSICVNLTVILKGMNFDNFNEYTSNSDRRYYRILSNNQKFCGNLSVYTKSMQQKYNITSATYYSSEWLSHNLINHRNYTNIYHYSLSENLTYNGVHHISQYFYSTKYLNYNVETLSKVFGIFPEITSTLHYSHKYKYYPNILIPYSNISETTNQFNQINQTIKEYLKNPSNMRYFLGSSHMRYNYLAIVDYLYGDQLTLVEEDPLDMSYFNLYNYGNTIASTLFADDQGDFLLSICKQFQSSSRDGIHQTIIFQTGSWDLAFMPLGKLIRDFSATKLIRVVTKILSGDTACGNLNHFIWMTTVPYRTSFIDNLNEWGHRYDAAIAAVNQFYLKRLMKAKINDKIKLSIVDSYSIIKPRIILNQYNEIVCKNHYTCADAIDNKSKFIIVHTPAGDAVLEALLIALSTK